MPRWLEIALEPSTVARALKFALVVGAVLIAINHGDAILKGALGARRLGKMTLTMLVPYVVSTLSTVGARLEHERVD